MYLHYIDKIACKNVCKMALIENGSSFVEQPSRVLTNMT